MAEKCAIGMIETKGSIPLLQAVDSMQKGADIEVIGREYIGDGYMCLYIKGTSGAVSAAIDIGSRAAELTGELLGASMIRNPGIETEHLIRRAVLRTERGLV